MPRRGIVDTRDGWELRRCPNCKRADHYLPSAPTYEQECPHCGESVVLETNK